MSRVLVVYASHYGQTRAIAECIAERLGTRGHHVDLVDARKEVVRRTVPEAYDVVVLGSRVELGRHCADVLDYIRSHRDALHEMPTGFFSVSMSASRPDAGSDPSDYLIATFDDLDWYPAQSIAFADGLSYQRYGWIMRHVMMAISRAGGHTIDTTRKELTDWKAVAAFADKIEYIAGGIHIEPTRPWPQVQLN